MSEQQFTVHREHKFGWCMPGETANHDGCRMRFSYYEKDYQCACECHAKKSLPPLEPGVNMHPTKMEKTEKSRAPRSPKKK